VASELHTDAAMCTPPGSVLSEMGRSRAGAGIVSGAGPGILQGTGRAAEPDGGQCYNRQRFVTTAALGGRK
jgi:hypothetical protein